MSDGAGKPKVVIVRDQTNITSGIEVQEKLILAARVFSDLLKPTFGPRGLDKMLYKTDGTTAITNDGAKIVAELLVKHPAAKMMVSMGNMQEETCGDGVTTTMLLCGSMLIEAHTLLKKGLHPLTLVDGYQMALKIAKEQIDNDVKPVNNQNLLSIAETALRGKGAETALNRFSPIIVESLTTLSKNRENPSAEHVTMFKTGLGSLQESKLLKGIIIKRRILMDNLPNNLMNPKVAVLNSDLKIRKLTRSVEIKINTANQLDSFVDAEQDRKNSITNAIIKSGVNAIFCSGEIDRDILHQLSDNDILTVGELDSSEIENIANAVGATLIDSILDINSSDLGECKTIQWERRENTDQVEDIIKIDGCINPKIVTIEVGGSGDIGTDEIIRGLHDSLRATSIAMADNEIVPGAGSIHSRMANAVRKASEAEPGRARLAMEAYARSLETIPATLVENAGGDSLDRILELRAISRDNEKPIGITPEGVVSIINDVWHPRLVIEASLQSATDTAMSMLRIDQVISARGD
ncbi:MAG: TCP-1/cpn60 chaperonin family protein [Candidatus Thalassarchaeaceae archaeon]|nr:TCP-1/cpn60 chaperonin family protein [Candidatus Thalassarchaeaceae archaeon]